MLLVVSEPSRNSYNNDSYSPSSPEDSPYRKSSGSIDLAEENGQPATIIGMKYKSGDCINTEPERRKVYNNFNEPETPQEKENISVGLLDGESGIKKVFGALFKPVPILLCIAACFRHLGEFI